MMACEARGSIWRRWDPHIHAPGTALNDRFTGPDALEAYLGRLEAANPAIGALGVTDYFSTNCYRLVLDAQSKGRLPNVFLFPNIELRLSIGTQRGVGVNMHLLIDPDGDDYLEQVDRFLARLTFKFANDTYDCTAKDLTRLGHAHAPEIKDDAAAYRDGVNQFKVDFNQLRQNLNENSWMKTHALVAVAAGTGDGTSGLQDASASFDAQRKEIEKFAHIIFSGSEKQVDFWLGQGSLSVDEVAKSYDGPKPCIHGSDAHTAERVAKPDLDRFTWVKGDATFESLRQTCIEPASRVFVGALPAELRSPDRTIHRVATAGAPWLLDSGVEINPGLVAIIGARGSGKTALVDLLAHGGGSSLPLEGQDSFISRAGQFLKGAEVTLEWSNGDTSTTALDVYPESEPDVHYLSQQFVERLCSPEAVGHELIDEIEKVVFAAHDPATRLGATSFAELLDAKIGDTREKQRYLSERLDRFSEDVLAERKRKDALPKAKQTRAELKRVLDNNLKLRGSLVRSDEKQRTEYYTRLRTAVDERDRRIQALRRQLQSLDHLAADVKQLAEHKLPDMHEQLQTKYQDVKLSEADWTEFQLKFAGDPVAVIARQRKQLSDRVEMSLRGSTTDVSSRLTVEQLALCSLEALKAGLTKVESEIGIDRQNAQKLQRLNQQIATQQLQLEKLDKDIALYEGSSERLKKLVADRAVCYKEFFELVVDEERSLSELYQPLQERLGKGSESVGRLRLTVVRVVDVKAWAAQGEVLIDLRKAGTFRGQGALERFARTKLVPAWESGDAASVAAAMAEFREEYDAALLQQSAVDKGSPDYQQWTIDVGRWLYSTKHIAVKYSFEYDGLALSQLSPGSRGLILLLLYLALDVEDHRPLIIDQPEENLDPRSVFSELVGLFRSARSRRQVIIVTHNANLVVNTDVDQVIVASCKRMREGQAPEFAYHSGGLENGSIRADVCDILEGGEEAFRERAKRLRVHDY